MLICDADMQDADMQDADMQDADMWKRKNTLRLLLAQGIKFKLKRLVF